MKIYKAFLIMVAWLFFSSSGNAQVFSTASVKVDSITASPVTAAPGQTVKLSVTLTSDMNLSNYPVLFSWHSVGTTSNQLQQVFFSTFTQGKPLTVSYNWIVPANQTQGAYLFDAAVFNTSWTTKLVDQSTNFTIAPFSIQMNSIVASPKNPAPGQTVTLSATMTANQTVSNYPVLFSWFLGNNSNQIQNVAFTSFPAGKAVTVSTKWVVPTNAALGTYTFDASVFNTAWSKKFVDVSTSFTVAPVEVAGPPSVSVDSLTVSPASVQPGQTAVFKAVLTANQNLTGYPVEFSYSAVGAANQPNHVGFTNFTANTPVTVTYSWTVPAGSTAGAYVVNLGVYNPAWTAGLVYGKANFAVTTITPTPTSTTPPSVPGLSEFPGPSAALLASHTYSGGIGLLYSCTRNFYVATNGSDTNNGTTTDKAWATIQHADTTSLQPGDCINVAAGNYTWNNGFIPTKGGSSATSTGYVAYRCQSLDACHITYTGYSGGKVWLFYQPYVVVDGFDVDGGESSVYGGLAASCFDSGLQDDNGTGKVGHHIWILNNKIHGCNLSGVTLNDSEYYFTIHNEIYDNSWTSGYEGSAVGYVVEKALGSGQGNPYPAYTPTAQDNGFAPFHMMVSWNKVHDNGCTTCLGSTLSLATQAATHSNATLDGLGNTWGLAKKELVVGPGIQPLTYVLAVNGSSVTLTRPATASANGGTYQFFTLAGGHTDGNGIIMDTWCGAPYVSGNDANLVDYPNQTLIAFNDVENNGGRGIHLFASMHITVANNSTYDNGLDPEHSGTDMAELSEAGGISNSWYNNTALAVLNTIALYPNSAIVAGNGRGVVDTNTIWQHNVASGANGVSLYDGDLSYWPAGTNKIADPLYVNAASGNLSLQSGSPASGYLYSLPFLPAGVVNTGAY